jgi:hypothetical protein
MIKLPVATYPIAINGKTLAAIVISADVLIEVSVLYPPDPESIEAIHFTREGPMQKGVVQLQAVDPAKQLTSRPVRIDFADGTPSVTIDVIDPNASFTANDGATGTATPTGSVNAAGTGPAGAAFSWTATGVGVGLPDAEVVTAVNFTPA